MRNHCTISIQQKRREKKTQVACSSVKADFPPHRPLATMNPENRQKRRRTTACRRDGGRSESPPHKRVQADVMQFFDLTAAVNQDTSDEEDGSLAGGKWLRPRVRRTG
jgi:hypothetical protein